MVDPITGTCNEDDCTNDVEIGNPSWLTSITNLDREELCYCDEHFENAIGSVTIDLGVGTPHTGSDDYEGAGGLDDL